jgi:uncharacterized metal-binding protein
LTWVKTLLPPLRQISGVIAKKIVKNNDRELPKVPQSKPATVVYACSGCSDAGELADRIARRLAREGAAEMSCLAGIGGRVKSLVAKAESAERILAIDGCPLNCTRHTLELAGFNNFAHLELHRLGFRKNFCPVTEECISSGVQAAREILSRKPHEHAADEPLQTL